jgi:hypothetical protein
MSDSEEKRKKAVEEIYLRLLEREPDTAGLNAYLYSDIPLEQVEIEILNSVEYSNLQRKKHFGANVESLGSKEMLLMGSSPSTYEHIKTLKEGGVKAVLNLDNSVSDDYPSSEFEHYLNVPLDRDKLITIDDLNRILNFLYRSMIVLGKKSFVHSDRGVERSPMVVALFLMAERKLSFKEAITILTTKQSVANPGINLISSEILKAAKDFVFETNEEATVDEKILSLDFVEITNTLVVGKKLNSFVADKLKISGVKTVLDMNTEKIDLPSNCRWFSHMHIPVDEKQLSTIMKVALRSANKYSKNGKLYVVCKSIPILLMFVENYLLNFVKATDSTVHKDFRDKLMLL